MNGLVLITCAALSVTFTIAKITKTGPIARFHAKDGWGTGILYYLAALFSIMVTAGVGPAIILDEEVGGTGDRSGWVNPFYRDDCRLPGYVPD